MPTNPSIQWDHIVLYMFYKKNFVAIMAPITKLIRKTNFSLDIGTIYEMGT
jgi:hypothetical protein